MAKQDINKNVTKDTDPPNPVLKQRIPIGMKVYLFKDNRGISHKLANECLLSARASVIDPAIYYYEKRLNKYYEGPPPTFRVPGNVILRFYSEPGNEPDDGASVRRFHENNQYNGYWFINHGGGSLCPNLILSKYQVTYQNTNVNPIPAVDYNPHDITAKPYPFESYDSYDQYPYDIVTVRHRLLLGNTTLEHLIELMEKSNRHFTVFHCLFSPYT